MVKYILAICYTIIFSVTEVPAQQNGQIPKPAYIIKNGVLLHAANGQEAALFGVNYTAPFAFSYRAIAKKSIAHEQAIQQDVYHMARLGFDAFRVHVWDTEISDRQGNLLQNEHLRLFDFLLAELAKYNIKSIITPIAFWGNGYPAPDEATPGFSRYYGKDSCVTKDSAIAAQENYLRQFFRHKNTYTGKTYIQDTNIIATEINNEPKHSGNPEAVTRYINRLYDAIRSTGWNKPVFYNISESPRYARSVTLSKADGYSFQWYPSGLVGGKSIVHNSLPHVDRYRLPFADSLPGFKNKPLMVYEFDPADIMQPVMYPAMARSFRSAGFQWATQFAYDPLAIASTNTEYQTHYLNLACTPAKAISAMIAGEVFRYTKRQQAFPPYPADSVFGPFRISYRQALSEMVSAEKFIYTGTTASMPPSPSSLRLIAGTGHSPVVQYSGTGAYFLDKIQDGLWRLEVMPDAVPLTDPYRKTSPQQPVVAIVHKMHTLQLALPDLGDTFFAEGLHPENNFRLQAIRGNVQVTPGTYLLRAPAMAMAALPETVNRLPAKGYAAPKPQPNEEIHVNHTPPSFFISGNKNQVSATLLCPQNSRVSLLVARPGWVRPREVPMALAGGYCYSASIPDDLAGPGVVQYRIMVSHQAGFVTFPGAVKGNPLAWDYPEGQVWEVVCKAPNADIPLFDPWYDRNPVLFPAWGRGINSNIIAASSGNDLLFQYYSNSWPADSMVALQAGTNGRLFSGMQKSKLVVKGRALNGKTLKAKVILVSRDGMAWQHSFLLGPDTGENILSLADFTRHPFVLLPRPYPGFQALWSGAAGTGTHYAMHPEETDLVQFVVQQQDNPDIDTGGPCFELMRISLRQ